MRCLLVGPRNSSPVSLAVQQLAVRLAELDHGVEILPTTESSRTWEGVGTPRCLWGTAKLGRLAEADAYIFFDRPDLAAVTQLLEAGRAVVMGPAAGYTDHAPPPSLDFFRAATQVLAPAAEFAAPLLNGGLRNCTVVPWWSGGDPVARPPDCLFPQRILAVVGEDTDPHALMLACGRQNADPRIRFSFLWAGRALTPAYIRAIRPQRWARWRYGSLPAALHDADLLWCCGFADPYGSWVVEGMRAGLPVVACNVAGAGCYLLDGDPATVLPCSTPESWLAWLPDFLQRPAAYRPSITTAELRRDAAAACLRRLLDAIDDPAH